MQDRRCYVVEVANGGTLLTSCDNSIYHSIFKHRSASGTKHEASIWKISVEDECHTFCVAKRERWADSDGNLWSIASTGSPDYGTRRQRIAFFDCPREATTPWHGYPVGGDFGFKPEDYPPDALVVLWQKSGRITYTVQQKLLQKRGKKC